MQTTFNDIVEDFISNKIGISANFLSIDLAKKLKGNLNDCFEEAGKGFGETYNFKYYPARIDYIFADKKIKVKQFSNFSDFKNSDHFPIIARLNLEQ